MVNLVSRAPAPLPFYIARATGPTSHMGWTPPIRACSRGPARSLDRARGDQLQHIRHGVDPIALPRPTSSTTLEIILPSDGAEGDVLASRELDRREPIRLGPRIASGCTSLACRDANTWSSNSQSPAANRIRQFFNVLASLLITSFSPNHTLP